MQIQCLSGCVTSLFWHWRCSAEIPRVLEAQPNSLTTILSLTCCSQCVFHCFSIFTLACSSLSSYSRSLWGATHFLIVLGWQKPGLTLWHFQFMSPKWRQHWATVCMVGLQGHCLCFPKRTFLPKCNFHNIPELSQSQKAVEDDVSSTDKNKIKVLRRNSTFRKS